MGRSFCPNCRKKIFWFDNIPLLSFVLLGGECRFCKKPINLRYFLVELTGGVLFVGIYFITVLKIITFAEFVFLLAISGVLLSVFVSDFLYYTIPDEAVIFGTILSLLFLILHSPTLLPNYLAAATGAGLFFLFLVLITKKKGMGFGDVKLAGLMGLILGFPNVVWAIFGAFLSGAIVGVILLLSGRKKWKSQIAFGPFLAGATLFVIYLSRLGRL